MDVELQISWFSFSEEKPQIQVIIIINMKATTIICLVISVQFFAKTSDGNPVPPAEESNNENTNTTDSVNLSSPDDRQADIDSDLVVPIVLTQTICQSDYSKINRKGCLLKY